MNQKIDYEDFLQCFIEDMPKSKLLLLKRLIIKHLRFLKEQKSQQILAEAGLALFDTVQFEGSGDETVIGMVVGTDRNAVRVLDVEDGSYGYLVAPSRLTKVVRPVKRLRSSEKIIH